ncbi:hypothetical protein GH733_017700 [Mirounga leonina]|nr:hypothetical protein GH733_017700 [Mirounga leonina]
MSCGPTFRVLLEPKPKSQDEFKDPGLRALRSKKCELEQSKKVLEDQCNALRICENNQGNRIETAEEESRDLGEFYEQRKVAAKEKLEMTHYKLVAKKNQL